MTPHPCSADLLHVEIDGLELAEQIVGVFRVQAYWNIDAIPDFAEDEGETLLWIPGQGIGMRSRLAERCLDIETRAEFDQRFLMLAIGNEVGNRQKL